MSTIGNDWKVLFFGISLLLINFIQAFPITTVGPSAFVRKSEVGRKIVVLHDAVTEPSALDPNEPRLILSPYIPESLVPLFEQAALTTIPKPFDATKDGTEKYNYEWGSWVNEETLSKLRSCIDEVQLTPQGFQMLVGEDSDKTRKLPAERYKVASGQKWECYFHVLPTDAQYEGSWSTGSWTIVKSLTGVAEIAMLREKRDGGYRKTSQKDLRGGSISDGTKFTGGGATTGAPCIKFLGGPRRSYMGKSLQTTVLLEFVILTPISNEKISNDVDEVRDLEKYLKLVPIEVQPSINTTEQKLEVSGAETAQNQSRALGKKLGMDFDLVGGLDNQLDAIVRRVLSSRANPEAARRLGISHVRGILLSGPPGCGKTLLARELARLLGAREPQIVNGPEILDKFIGEAEKRVRDLFLPAELEYAQVGDDSALHIIILDEMDAIARKRGSASSDTTGVRDSVVNQLLAKMDGVKQANNILVVGLTNRPELIDPALLRPGRLEVQLRVELPDLHGRRDIFRIHTRQMKESNGITSEAESFIEDLGESGLPARSEYFSGAEIAGLVRSAASFALARCVDAGGNIDVNTSFGNEESKVSVKDLEQALTEVRPALGRNDEVLRMRYPHGISPYNPSMQRILRDLRRFTVHNGLKTSRIYSLLLVGAGSEGGSGVTALGAWAAANASSTRSTTFVRFITAIDVLAGSSGSGDESRAASLMDKVYEARETSNSLLVLDDIDQLCAGSGPGGYSSVMIATLRALLRMPPESSSTATASGQSRSREMGKYMHILATTSRSDAACSILYELFDETLVVPLLTDVQAVENLINDSSLNCDSNALATTIIDRMGEVGCKTVLRLVERAIATLTHDEKDEATKHIDVLNLIIDDMIGNQATSKDLCDIF